MFLQHQALVYSEVFYYPLPFSFIFIIYFSFKKRNWDPWTFKHDGTGLGFSSFSFLMWTIFEVFVQGVTISLLFLFCFFWPGGMWDLSSQTRDPTHTAYIERQTLNHWTTREVLGLSYLFAFRAFSKYFVLLWGMWITLTSKGLSLFGWEALDTLRSLLRNEVKLLCRFKLLTSRW